MLLEPCCALKYYPEMEVCSKEQEGERKSKARMRQKMIEEDFGDTLIGRVRSKVLHTIEEELDSFMTCTPIINLALEPDRISRVWMGCPDCGLLLTSSGGHFYGRLCPWHLGRVPEPRGARGRSPEGQGRRNREVSYGNQVCLGCIFRSSLACHAQLWS